MNSQVARTFVFSSMLVSVLLTGCRTMEPKSFEGASPRFQPDKFFEGPVRSWGVMEDRSGNPKSRFRASIVGRREGDGLMITQDFTFEDGRTQQRIWRIRRIDEHVFEATSPDVVGVARGEAFGNAYYWTYTLAVHRGNPLTNVWMRHWMYLADDGETMINRVVISKFGVKLGETTEYFRRGTGDVPSIGAGH